MPMREVPEELLPEYNKMMDAYAMRTKYAPGKSVLVQARIGVYGANEDGTVYIELETDDSTIYIWVPIRTVRFIEDML